MHREVSILTIILAFSNISVAEEFKLFQKSTLDGRPIAAAVALNVAAYEAWLIETLESAKQGRLTPQPVSICLVGVGTRAKFIRPERIRLPNRPPVEGARVKILDGPLAGREVITQAEALHRLPPE